MKNMRSRPKPRVQKCQLEIDLVARQPTPAEQMARAVQLILAAIADGGLRSGLTVAAALADSFPGIRSSLTKIIEFLFKKWRLKTRAALAAEWVDIDRYLRRREAEQELAMALAQNPLAPTWLQGVESRFSAALQAAIEDLFSCSDSCPR